MLKKIIICLVFFFASTVSCSEKKQKVEVTSECEQIKDIVTDCMGLHRGSFDYIESCGDLSLEEVKKMNNCKDIFQYIEEN